LSKSYAASHEVPGVPGDKDEAVNPRRCCERQVPTVFVLGSDHSRPFFYDDRVDGNNPVCINFLDRRDCVEQDFGSFWIATCQHLCAAALLEEGRDA